MKVLQAPETMKPHEEDLRSLFLAGGISNCPLWQDEMIEGLRHTGLLIINPRRTNFDASDRNMEKEQITWEHEHLHRAFAVSFWFPCETLCPITLFELGKVASWLGLLFIGVHPKYSRIRDIRIQMSLMRPGLEIAESLEALATQIKHTPPAMFRKPSNV